MVAELERAWREPVRVTCHAPPQHAKTDTVLAFVVATLKRAPHIKFGYATYDADLAKSKSGKAREWAMRHGVELRTDSQSKSEWVTKSGGGMRATSVGGRLTGDSVDIMLVDDPYKDRAHAESAAWRRSVEEFMSDIVETRVPETGSVFVWHARWVPDDLIGSIHKSDSADDWTHINLPVVNDKGEPLWPQRYTREGLEKRRQRMLAYSWLSLYMGTPRGRGDQVFKDAHYYDAHALPTAGYQPGLGLDLAYSKKTHADWSVCLSGRKHNGFYYLTNMIRKQLRAPEFMPLVKTERQAYPGAPVKWYAAGTEHGTADFYSSLGVPVEVIPAREDKLIRAEPAAVLWNAGKILLPNGEPWVPVVVEEVCGFTGVGDAHDDIVDALAAFVAACDAAGTGEIEIVQPRVSAGLRGVW